MDNLKHLAGALDSALDALEEAVSAYLAATAAANRAHMAANVGRRQGLATPHPVYEGGPDHVRFAVGGRHDLARILGVSFAERRPVAARYE